MYILTGDTHGNLMNLIEYNCKLDVDDTLIVLGDFGFIWDNDDEMVEQKLRLVDKYVDYQIAFIDGNHENFPRIYEQEVLERWNGGRVGRLSNKIVHLLRGEVYNLNGKRVAVMGGANSIDKKFRTAGKTWWEEEEITHDDINRLRANLKGDNKVDLVLTHDCPSSIVPAIALLSNVNRVKNFSASQLRLEEMKQMLEFDKWYFGHWHVDKLVPDKFECLFNSLKEV